MEILECLINVLFLKQVIHCFSPSQAIYMPMICLPLLDPSWRIVGSTTTSYPICHPRLIGSACCLYVASYSCRDPHSYDEIDTSWMSQTSRATIKEDILVQINSSTSSIWQTEWVSHQISHPWDLHEEMKSSHSSNQTRYLPWPRSLVASFWAIMWLSHPFFLPSKNVQSRMKTHGYFGATKKT